MKHLKKLLPVILALTIIFCFAACKDSGEENTSKTLTIAYQGGIGYAPVHILEAKKLIEKNYGGAVVPVF